MCVWGGSSWSHVPGAALACPEDVPQPSACPEDVGGGRKVSGTAVRGGVALGSVSTAQQRRWEAGLAAVPLPRRDGGASWSLQGSVGSPT